MRLGLFGGTFDPPHVAHLAMAERAREQLRLDRVVFMPVGRPPHKRARALSPAEDRIAMTRLAVRGNRAFTVSTLETRRPGTSYTIETLRALAAHHARARLFLVIGEDSLDDFPTWHEPRAILDLATLAVAPRPGSRRARAARLGARVVWIEAPALPISSSAIRADVRAGRSVRYLVPAPVAAYFDRHRLYARGAR